MTDRDQFAMAALKGLLASSSPGEPHRWYDPPGTSGAKGVDSNWAFFVGHKDWAVAAYKIADAMLEARGGPIKP